MTELGQPGKCLRVVHLGRYHLGDDVSGVYVDGTDGHDLLTVARGEFADQHADQGIQLANLTWYRMVKYCVMHGKCVSF